MLKFKTDLEGKRVRYSASNGDIKIIGTVHGVNTQYGNAMVYGEAGYSYRMVCRIDGLEVLD